MKKLKIIMLILLCVFCSTVCGKHSNSNERTESHINNIKENIDISQLNSSKITYNYGKADVSVYNPSLEELSENAEIIFKGTLNKMDAYLINNKINRYIN